jgi:hypothetical protein
MAKTTFWQFGFSVIGIYLGFGVWILVLIPLILIHFQRE